MRMPVDQAVQELLAARAEADAHRARADVLAAGLKQLALDRYREDGTITKWRVAGLGEVRLDKADIPARPTIVKPAEFADHLAQRDPAAVVATITLPADQLAAALDALAFAGIGGVTAAAAPIPDRAADWLADHAMVRAHPDTPGAWQVVEVEDRDGVTVLLGEVAGVTGIRPAPSLYVSVDRDLRARRVAQATADLEDETGEPVEPAPALVAADNGTSSAGEAGGDLAGLSHTDLRARCKSAGLPAAGSKQQLIERLAAKLAGDTAQARP